MSRSLFAIHLTALHANVFQRIHEDCLIPSWDYLSMDEYKSNDVLYLWPMQLTSKAI